MASCSSSRSRGNFSFADTMAAFLHCAGLPFVDILSDRTTAIARFADWVEASIGTM